MRVRAVQTQVRFQPEKSAELVDFRLIDVIRFTQFSGKKFLVNVMGLRQVFERVTVVPQLGVDQSEKQVGVHREISRKIHARKLRPGMIENKLGLEKI